MSDWWTYRLSDFLMFSPTVYWRLVERYNRDAWPLQVLMLGVGLLLLWLAAARPAAAGRLVAGTLAAIWLWVGWAFHHQAYAQINWVAEYAAIAFAVQAVLLVGRGVVRLPGAVPSTLAPLRRVGLALAVAGILVYPWAGLLAGRPSAQWEVFGLMPEPTALATLGLLLACEQRRRAWLMVIPLVSLFIGWATLWQFGS
ncbi:DUF6064 family protein [Caenimonas soli]|uniref:DUF6064 family protein n=1 Tax=Caenimonas soli TaxID=2735555 RepID=UPI001556729B|nr:DUF6064 family protein [Caenimonas soli]NPC54754.1 MFS transporter permease [Caenimonas soli]